MSTTESIQLPAELLDRAACGMALLDTENRLVWVNTTFGLLVESEPGSLLGLSTEALPQKASHVLFSEGHPIALHSGGEQRWLKRETHTHAGLHLAIFLDISESQQLEVENQRLRKQVDELKLNDDLTGLPNRRAISQALELQISRSRRYQNPLGVVLVSVGLRDEQVHALQSGIDPLVLGVSHFLRDRLRWVDQIGRWADDMFVLVLPETDQQDTLALVEKIQTEQNGLKLPEPFAKIHPHLSFGISYWQKGDDMRTLLRRAEEQLTAA